MTCISGRCASIFLWFNFMYIYLPFLSDTRPSHRRSSVGPRLCTRRAGGLGTMDYSDLRAGPSDLPHETIPLADLPSGKRPTGRRRPSIHDWATPRAGRDLEGDLCLPHAAHCANLQRHVSRQAVLSLARIHIGCALLLARDAATLR